jgi:hypothetical protein
MVWLITGLLLALFCGLTVLTRWAHRRPVTDDTLLADLLGPPTGQAPPAPPEREDVELRPEHGDVEPPVRREDVDPSPGRADLEPMPVPAAQPAGEDNWLETQIALIAAWSDRMQEQIASWADHPDLPHVRPEPEMAAPLADGSRRPGPEPREPPRPGPEPREPPQPRPVPGRCLATTATGSQCKLPARPGDTTCAIHGKRAHR